jgi:hypothetical protein
VTLLPGSRHRGGLLDARSRRGEIYRKGLAASVLHEIAKETAAAHPGQRDRALHPAGVHLVPPEEHLHPSTAAEHRQGAAPHVHHTHAAPPGHPCPARDIDEIKRSLPINPRTQTTAPRAERRLRLHRIVNSKLKRTQKTDPT